MRGSYNVTVVQSITPTSLPSPSITPTSLPSISQKKYQLLIITESQAALSDVIFLLPYFSHRINAFKCKTGDEVVLD